jgi:diguanylate cyclase (GGDEF)-like protein
MQKVHAFFLTQSKPSKITFILFIVFGFGYLDYKTGFEITFSFFYLIPIAIATWYIDRKTGYVIASLSIAIWIISNYMAGERYTYEIIRYWNAFIRLTVFIPLIWLLDEFKRALHHEHLLAHTDSLTGIPNSREFYFQVNAELLRASRFNSPFTIAYMDVDNFKQINDQFGHSEGDSILKSIAQSMLSNIRQTDIAARLGGDEFAVLLPNTDQSGAKFILDKVQNKLLEQMEKTNSKVTFSIGVVTFHIPPASVDELLRRADKIMYAVKAKGKNNIIFIQA